MGSNQCFQPNKLTKHSRSEHYPEREIEATMPHRRGNPTSPTPKGDSRRRSSQPPSSPCLKSGASRSFFGELGGFRKIRGLKTNIQNAESHNRCRTFTAFANFSPLGREPQSYYRKSRARGYSAGFWWRKRYHCRELFRRSFCQRQRRSGC